MQSSPGTVLSRSDLRQTAAFGWRTAQGQCPRGFRRNLVCRSVEFDVYRGAVPSSFQQQDVVPGQRTTVTPRITPEKAFERLSERIHDTALEHHRALYSSELGGIVTHPGYMFIHFDDHMVHRAHGVSESIVVAEGYMYQLGEHLGRLAGSMELAGLSLELTEAEMARIVLDTAAASMMVNGMVKVFVTGGRGGFGLSDDECTACGLYVVASSEEPKVRGDRQKGWRVIPTSLPPRAPYMADIHGPNMEAVIATLDAQRQGFDSAVFLGDDDQVLEGPDWALALITQADEFVFNPWTDVTYSITLSTLAGLLPEELDLDLHLKNCLQRKITMADILEAKEVMALNTTLGVMPITHWGEEPIADGTAGSMTMALQAVLENDRAPKEGSMKHLPVPYGILTGMKTQLL